MGAGPVTALAGVPTLLAGLPAFAALSPLDSPLPPPPPPEQMPATPAPAQPALSAYLALSRDRVEAGRPEPITVTLRVVAQVDAQDVVARLTLPPEVEYVAKGAGKDAGDPDAGDPGVGEGVSYDPARRELVWRIGALAASALDAGAAFSDVVSLMVTGSQGRALNVTLQPVVTATVPDAAQAAALIEAMPALIQLGLPAASAQPVRAAQGGRFELGERIRIDFAPGAFHADTVIRGVVYAPVVLRVDERGVPMGDFRLPFELGPDMAFDAPVTLTVDLAGLLTPEMGTSSALTSSVLAGRQPVVQYLRPELVTRTLAREGDSFVYTYTTRVVEDLPSQYDAATGLLTAQLSHFSEYQVGLKQPSDPQPWKLDARGGDVALFTGSAEYAYPLDLPAMHDGLQPGLTVRYSSAAADGRSDQDGSPGEGLSLGQGWRIDTPKITRRVKRKWQWVPWEVSFNGEPWWNNWAHCHDGDPQNWVYCHKVFVTDWWNLFTLELNGQTHNLQPKTPGQAGGEYVPESYAPLRVLRCNARAPCTGADALPGVTNSTGEYWQVWTPDGTRYAFGTDDDSANVIDAAGLNANSTDTTPYNPSATGDGAYAGSRGGHITRVWFLRRVYAAHRDSVSAGRWSAEYHYTAGANIVRGGCWYFGCLDHNDAWLKPASIVYGPSLRPDGSAATQRFQIGFEYTQQWTELDHKHLLSGVVISAPVAGSSVQVWRYEFGYGTWSDHRYAVTAIAQRYNGQALPGPALVYSDTGGGAEGRLLLTSVANGYGGEWQFSYATQSERHHPVLTRTVSNGSGWSGTTTYAYAEGCVNVAGQACVNPLWRTHPEDYDNGHIGYGVVTETAHGAAHGAAHGEALAITAHRYHTDYKRLGRAYETRRMDGAGRTLELGRTDFIALHGFSAGARLPDNAWMVAGVSNTVYAGDDTSATWRRAETRFRDAPIVVLRRGFKSGSGHWAGLTLPAGFTEEGRWELLAQPAANTQLLYVCQMDNHALLSPNSDCEGFTLLGVAGYIYTTQQAGTVALHRCYSTTYYPDHLLTTAADCEAPGLYTHQMTLGYARALPSGAPQDVAAMAVASQPAETREYNSATLARATTMSYTLNAAAWVLRPVTQTVRDGSGNRLNESRYYYDGNTSLGALGGLGDVTFHQAVDAAGNTARDYRAQYDALGNKIRETTYGNFGTPGSVAVAGRAGVTSSVAFDPDLGWFVVSSTNGLGQVTRYEYYGVNGQALFNNYGATFGLLKRVIPPNGEGAATRYEYDVFGRLTKVIRPYDSSTCPSVEYAYADNYQAGGLRGLRVTQKQREVSGQAGALETYTFYDGLGREMQARRESGNAGQQVVSDVAYDALGRVMRRYAPREADVSLDYSPPVTTGAVASTTTQYDALGRVARVVNPDGASASSVHIGAVVDTLDARGNYRREVRDGLGRLTRVLETLATLEEPFDTLSATVWATTTYQSVSGGVVENRASWPQTYQASLARQTASISSALAISTGVAQGVRVTFKVDRPADSGAHFMLWAQGGVTRRVALIVSGNKLVMQTTVDGGATWQYQDVLTPARADTWYVAILRAATVQNGGAGWAHVEVWERDNPAMRGSAVYTHAALAWAAYRFAHNVYTGTVWLDDYQEFSLWQTNYSYTARDDLVKVVDALGNTTLITYDGFGLKTGMKDPDMGVWTYGYDPAGNADGIRLITQTDAKGQTLRMRSAWFGYDGLNRLTEKRVNGAGGPVLAQYGYDGTADNVNGIGRRTSISNTQAQTRWTYDLRGRVQQEYITITGRTMPYGTAYQYDAADRLVRMGYPNGEAVTTTYDAGGQPYSLLGLNTYVVSATYNALGQPARTRFGNGLEARYWYFGLNTYPSWGNTAWGRLRRACVVTQTASGSCGDASPAPIFDLAYWYDLGGNIAYLDDVQNGGQRQYFGYDGLSRLVSAWTTAAGSGRYSETYAYNAIGNFVSKGGVTQWYSDTARAHAVTHLNGDRRAWYDQNGNMTQRVEMSGSQRITYTQEWDIENKLVAVTNTVAGQVTRFYRDADGALVKKSDGAGTVMIVGTHFEHITATNQSTSYYLFGGQRVAMRTSGAVYWLHGDHLGSASLTTNVSGQRVAELRYLPFGETRWAWGVTPTDRRYTGQREVPAIGLYDYNARMYWPAAGRFVSADTVVPRASDPQQLNRYAYARGNPLAYTDPTGHWIESALDIAAIALDIADIAANGLNVENGLSLVADVVGLVVPVFTGGGVIVRAALHADDVVDAVRAANRAADVAEVGIIVRQSRTLGPGDFGHVAAYTRIGDDVQVRGFYPQPRHLPPDKPQWRDFLFNNAVPGQVRADDDMLKQVGMEGVIQASRTTSVHDAQWVRTAIGDVGPRGSSYSFNPDNFANTFNCSTWACSTINRVIKSAPLPIVPQGRMKLTAPAVNSLPAPWRVQGRLRAE